ncbi:MAG: TolC family protein [Bacteroidales bacterium]|nr:TolC family protein [Bacteroidales bacterium]MDD4669908.1 TolC family protein [Bacteroidales bacterium]
MQYYLKTIALTAILLISSHYSSGQNRWSLQQCIEYAWDNNLQIKQQEIARDQEKNNLSQSKLVYLPSVNASVGHNFNWGRSVDMQELVIIENKLSQATSASLSASVPVFNGLSNYYNLKSSQIQLSVANLNIDKLKNDISIAITKAYLQLLLSKQIHSNALLSYESIVSQKEKTEKMVNAGSQPYSTLLEIEAQVASERVQVVNAQGQVSSNTLSLIQLLDLPYNSDFDIVTPDLESVFTGEITTSVEELYNEARELPQIKSAEYALDNSKIMLSMAKGALYPSISLSAGYGTFYSDAAEGAFKQQFSDNRNPSIGIGLRIPIFNGYQAATKVKNARLSVRNSEIALKTIHQDMMKEIQAAVVEAETCFERGNAARQNKKAMEESFRMAEQKYESGAVTSTDYIISKTNMLKAQSEYYQAYFQYVFQLKILDFYKGIPIKL